MKRQEFLCIIAFCAIVATGWLVEADVPGYTIPNAVSATAINLNPTIQAAGQTGAKTANTPSGNIRIAAAGTSVVVTNSLVTANSVILCTLGTADATATNITSVVSGAGSFTITLNAATTAEVKINWLVTN